MLIHYFARLILAGGLMIPVVLPAQQEPARAETGIPYLSNYGPKNYHAARQNWAILQDARNVMYFGNSSGILEYDGSSWRLIRMPNFSTVRALAVDSSGIIYVGAEDELGYLEPDSLGRLRFVSLRHFLKKDELNFGGVWRIHATKAGIYFFTRSQIMRWSNREFKTWPIRPLSLPNLVNGTYYYGEKGVGLMELQGDSLCLTPGGEQFANELIYIMLPFPESPDPKDSTSTENPRNPPILIGTRSGGLFLYNNGVAAPFPTGADEFLQSNQPYHGAVLPGGYIALATIRGGVAVIDRKGQFVQLLNRTSGLRDDYVIYTYMDRQGGLWLALNNGLARIEIPGPFSRFTEAMGVRGNVQSILRFRDAIYISTGLGIFYWNPAQFPPLYQPGGAASFSSIIIQPLFKAVSGIPPGQCWTLLSTHSSLLAATYLGIFQISGGEAKIINGALPRASFLYRSAQDTSLVFAGLFNGLAALRFENGKWRNLGTMDGITEAVNSIAEDGQGVLWLGTQYQGTIRIKLYPVSNGKLRGTVTRLGASYGLPGDDVYVYTVRGRVFFATKKGLRRFEETRQKFLPDSSFGEVYADTTRQVYRVIEDNKGRVWIASAFEDKTELDLLLPQENRTCLRVSAPFRRLADVYGIHTIYPDKNGEVWFGLDDEIVRYDPSIPHRPSRDAEFPALVRRVTLIPGDSLIFGGTPSNFAIKTGNRDNVEIAYKFHSLRFEFAAPFYSDESANRFRYSLDGFDKGWSRWTAETRKEYTNLPEGQYRFLVQARNIYDQTSRQGEYRFEILSPWYRSGWAYLMYLAVTGVLLYGIREYELQRLRKRHEMEIKLLEAEKLKEMDRMKSRFFANISHEFRTPLTLILGPLEKLLSEKFDAPVKTQFRIMLRNGRRLLRLINQLLDLSRLEAGSLSLKARRENIVPLLKGIVYSFYSLAERKQIDFRFTVAKQAIFAYIDRDKFEKIMFNLLSNAFKFTPEGGSVIVDCRLRTADLKNKSEISDFVEITINDTGIGIPREHLDKIFDRFYRVDPPLPRLAEGSGIGLALTKELVDLHQGDIRVASELAKGTTFIVKLPARPGSLEKTPEEVHLTPGSSTVESMKEIDMEITADTADCEFEEASTGISTSAKPDDLRGIAQSNLSSSAPLLLIIDDNADVRRFIREPLEENYRILEAENGEEGMELSRQTIPDLVISDVMMPGMDGFELCHRLKNDELTSHIPVILLTARASGGSKVEGLETGADDYIIKPFNARELHARVKNLIQQRRQLSKRFLKEGRLIGRFPLLLPGEIPITSMDEQFLRKARDLIEENIADAEFSTEKFASEMAMSRMQLHRKLRALTSHSTHSFIRLYRLHRAAQLLQHHAGTVTEICYDVGFNNLSHFAKAFREQFGQSPSEFAAGTEAPGPGGE